MNERQREYFRRKLNLWKEEILKESRETIQNPAGRDGAACRSRRQSLHRGHERQFWSFAPAIASAS